MSILYYTQLCADVFTFFVFFSQKNILRKTRTNKQQQYKRANGKWETPLNPYPLFIVVAQFEREVIFWINFSFSVFVYLFILNKNLQRLIKQKIYFYITFSRYNIMWVSMKKKMNIKKKKEKERQHFTVKMLCDVFFFYSNIEKKPKNIFISA